MVTVSQGEVWWADLAEPAGSAPDSRHPVVVVQGDALNQSRISTVACVPLTSNMDWAEAPGNVELPLSVTGPPKDSVANVSQILTVDHSTLMDRVGKLPQNILKLVIDGIGIIFGQ
jgi:mRNA interferase MazF